jgi:hypothetical protein
MLRVRSRLPQAAPESELVSRPSSCGILSWAAEPFSEAFFFFVDFVAGSVAQQVNVRHDHATWDELK